MKGRDTLTPALSQGEREKLSAAQGQTQLSELSAGFGK
jgi:hypothetical protein